ncbi:uncharacterized protein LOC126629387 [Malus sylvestris]|uniref:uncharacterized protein LOC126629387 n=1 Tax=Malus sylvestris TaxID=3752 RepID=UPI0021AC7487|nr:uncharacterized protein LOC126629387 [Malus sylvestris]
MPHVIVPDSSKKLSKPEELRGNKYCKLHYTFNNSITNCVQFRDWIQDLIVKGKLLLEKLQANMMVDTNPFLEAPINMINLTWAEKGKGKATWEVKVERRQVVKPIELAIKLPEKSKAAIIKRVMLCSKC